jgi:hypothetical protein
MAEYNRSKEEEEEEEEKLTLGNGSPYLDCFFAETKDMKHTSTYQF